MPLEGIDALVFDVYGTLLDVSTIDARCREITPRAGDFVALWRAKQLEYAFVRTLIDDYTDFWALTADALDHTAARFGLTLDRTTRARLMEGWLELRPFPDVPPALEALSTRPLVVLSNGSPAMLDAVLTRSGLKPRFRDVLSVDAVRRFKPHPAVYALAPAYLNIPAGRVLFVTANGFDVAGAKHFGFQVCRVNRAGTPLDRLGIEPDVTVASLGEMPGRLGKTAPGDQ